MAKALVFEGCPACERNSGLDGMRHHYDDMGLGAISTNFMDTAKEFVIGGAVGAGGVIVINMLVSKFLPTLSSTIKNVALAGLVIAGAAYTEQKYPQISRGLAVGGGALILSSFIAPMLSKIAPSSAPVATSGLGQVSVVQKPYGVLVAEEMGDSEIIV